jgi:hypothetical protein
MAINAAVVVDVKVGEKCMLLCYDSKHHEQAHTK